MPKDIPLKPSLTPPSLFLNDAAAACVDARNYAHRTGHGVMAERLNFLMDVDNGLEGVVHLGANNSRHGADKMLGRIPVQTKYYETARASVDACFDQNGNFKYAQDTVIEVAADHVPEAARRLAQRLGVSKSRARQLIRGGIPSQDARDLCRPLTLTSIRYDAKLSQLAFLSSFAASTGFAFAGRVVAGDKFQDAAIISVKIGGQSGLTACATYVLSAQLGRSGFERSIRPLTKWTATHLGARANRVVGLAAGKKPSIDQTSKLLNGQIVAVVASTTAQSIPDIYRYATGKMTGRDAIKSVGNAALGAGVQQIGGHIGAVMGTIAGGWVSSGAAAKAGGVAGRFAGEIAAARIAAFVTAISFGAPEAAEREIREILTKVACEVAAEQNLSPDSIDRYLNGLAPLVSELADALHKTDRDFQERMCRHFCEFSARLEIRLNANASNS